MKDFTGVDADNIDRTVRVVLRDYITAYLTAQAATLRLQAWNNFEVQLWDDLPDDQFNQATGRLVPGNRPLVALGIASHESETYRATNDVPPVRGTRHFYAIDIEIVTNADTGSLVTPNNPVAAGDRLAGAIQRLLWSDQAMADLHILGVDLPELGEKRQESHDDIRYDTLPFGCVVRTV